MDDDKDDEIDWVVVVGAGLFAAVLFSMFALLDLGF